MKYLWLLSLILSIACHRSSNKDDDNILARAYDDYLYESNLEGVIPEGTHARDSLILVKNFINNWIKEKLLAHKAENNLTNEQKDFSQQLEEYRNSLIIYEYERKLIQQELDTLVLFKEIEQYYDNYKHNFILKEDVFLIDYLILDKESHLIEKFRLLLNSGKPEDKDTLQHLCPVHTIDFNLAHDYWLTLPVLIRTFPFHSFNQDDFKSSMDHFQFDSNGRIYLFTVKEYITKDNIAPLGFVKKNIKEIIINKRKAELLNKMHEEIMNKAIKSKDFDIY